MKLIHLKGTKPIKSKSWDENRKMNLILKEKKGTLGIYLLDNIEFFLCGLFGDKIILEHLIGFEKNNEWIAIHFRGNKVFIAETTKLLKSKFHCDETTVTRDLKFIAYCSSYLKRLQKRHDEATKKLNATYGKILRQLAGL